MIDFKLAVKRSVRALGLDIRRVARTPSNPPYSIDPAEAAELDALLESFRQLHPHDCEPWSKPQRAKEYLTPKRIASYHDLLATCQRHGITWADRSVGEVGSGTGYLLRLIHRAAPSARLTGFDSYREITALARHLCPQAAFADRDLFKLDGQRFDVVICMEVLEHLIDPEEALSRLLAMVAPGGALVLTVPDGRTDAFPALDPYPNGKGYWGHINFWSPESWRIWLSRQAPTRTLHCGRLLTGENYAIL